MKKKGIFITFEGGEGCGKSTAIEHISGKLKGEGISHLITMEPGGTKAGKKIRKILLSPDSRGMSPETELLLYCASRSEHVREVIKPALQSGQIVICDRFDDATIAYQGYGRGLKISEVKNINDFACDNLKPDLTILFDINPEEGLKRAAARNDRDGKWDEGRFEKEKMQFHEKVRKGYLRIAENEKRRVKVIDASVKLSEMLSSVWREIEMFLGKKGFLSQR